MRNVSELKETHWHKADVQAWENVAAAIPAVIETNAELWAKRIERREPTELIPHKSLFVIEAERYARRADGVTASTGHKLSFMVAADCRRDACECVERQLTAHGFIASQWALASSTVPLILSC